MIAVDFGTGSALAIHGPNGSISKKSLQLPKVKGGKTPRDEFKLILDALLSQDDVVVESPTIGSSGCEVQDVKDILQYHSHKLYTLSARVVKNYRMDHNIPNPKSYGKYNTHSDHSQEESHVEDAEILYKVATEHPIRLREWHVATPCIRHFTSVRPMDKRGYRDARANQNMELLPPFESLPDELQQTLGTKIAKTIDYSRSMVVPFAMALQEPYLYDGAERTPRRRFEKIIGMYDHGYPSFYRRAVNVWMQKVAADSLGLPRYSRDKVSPVARKAAWKTTQRQIRWFFHLCMAHNS